MIDCLMVGLLPSSCFVMVGWLMVYRLVSQDRLFAGVGRHSFEIRTVIPFILMIEM